VGVFAGGKAELEKTHRCFGLTLKRVLGTAEMHADHFPE
jgi:hypothetical protein